MSALNVGRITFGPTNVPNATVTHYQLQLAKQKIVELRNALIDVMHYVGDGDVLMRKEFIRVGRRIDEDASSANMEYNEQCSNSLKTARALLAKLDAEDKAENGVT